jgi:ATP synthase in type III secretion protein N
MSLDLDRFTVALRQALQQDPPLAITGKVFEVVGTLIRVSGMNVKLGELCELRDRAGVVLQKAEVVGISRNTAILSPLDRLEGISVDTRVFGTGRPLSVPVGNGLFGRVLSGLGEPTDGKGELLCHETRPVYADPPDPMSRRIIEQAMPTGVKAIDALLTLGEGQRMGIFAPAGVGKSTLMGMLARGTECDVNVIALIGERGREVREFIELILGEAGMRRSVVICATSDRSSLERAKAAYLATSVAEHFRDRGMKVLLMMDSLTRFARALREIGLARGEPPARRGFPPSVFAEIPRLLERAGMGKRGSITALYTVLAEDDTGSDPIAEEVRGILDGHMILSRRIAAKNQYPAIDVLASLSRVMTQVAGDRHQQAAAKLRKLLAKYDEIEPLLQIGEYARGNDPLGDEAVAKVEAIRAFLGQRTERSEPFDGTLRDLERVIAS